jgi:hypothetical protein
MRSIAEVDTALETLADEACIAGPTPIETFYDGRVTMRWLYENRRDRPFLVWAWDFEIGDWCLACAKEPRITKVARTRRIFLDDGTDFRATGDHRVLLPNQEWTTVGELKRGSELMAFYRLTRT